MLEQLRGFEPAIAQDLESFRWLEAHTDERIPNLAGQIVVDELLELLECPRVGDWNFDRSLRLAIEGVLGFGGSNPVVRIFICCMQ